MKAKSLQSPLAMAVIHLLGAINIMEKIKLWSDLIGTWVAIIGAFTGGILAFLQYADQASSARVQESLKYVERLNTEPLFGIQAHLETFWNQRAENILNPNEEEKALFEYINTEIKDNKLEADSVRLISLFDSLQTCTRANLCDEATTLIFMGKLADDLNGLYHPFIVSQRNSLKDNSFGIGVELLSKKYKDQKQNLHSSSPIPPPRS